MRQFGLLILVLVAFAISAAQADDVAVTVYNSNLGVVSETRTLTFEKGMGELSYQDVPTQIDASSVTFDLLDDSRTVNLLEQNYAYDLVSPGKMYNRYIDQEIELISEDGELYSGTLMSVSNNAATLAMTDGRIKIVSLDKIIEVNFPVLPEGLITRPTLFWLYNSDFSGDMDTRVSYQTSGMSWNAEYVGLLNDAETELSLTGWSSITNNSGKTYKDATLKLVAGDIHRARQPQRGDIMMKSMAAESAEGFQQKQFFEYHLYTLPRKATVANNEIKQISLFEPASTPVEKIYLFEPERNPDQVKVAVEFTNSQAAGLGMPLPEGRVRLFKADDDGSKILLGEDRIDHTPKDEEVQLTVGYAFDIAAEMTMTDQSRVSSRVEERTWEFEIRNHKDEDVTVTIEKRLWGYWEVVDAGAEYTKKDANTITMDVTVPADTDLTVSLKVRFTSR